VVHGQKKNSYPSTVGDYSQQLTMSLSVRLPEANLKNAHAQASSPGKTSQESYTSERKSSNPSFPEPPANRPG